MKSIFLRFKINIVLQFNSTEVPSAYLVLQKNVPLKVGLSFLTNKIRPISKVVKLFISAYHIALGFKSAYLTRLEMLSSRFLRASVEVELSLEDIFMSIKNDRFLLKRLYFVMFPSVRSFTRKFKLTNSIGSSSALSKLSSKNDTLIASAVLDGLFEFLKEDGYASLYNLVDWPTSLQATMRADSQNFLLLSLINLSNNAA